MTIGFIFNASLIAFPFQLRALMANALSKSAAVILRGLQRSRRRCFAVIGAGAGAGLTGGSQPSGKTHAVWRA